MRSIMLSFLASLFSSLSFIAATTVGAEERMKIVASFSILGDMVEQVVGERGRQEHTRDEYWRSFCAHCYKFNCMR